jgi:ribosomal protein L37AE/L43A
MSEEINFCPYCDAPQHKIIIITEKIYFCKECDKFFRLEKLELKCLKCEFIGIKDADFPAADGSIIFQCTKCKKMFSSKEFLKKNKIK